MVSIVGEAELDEVVVGQAVDLEVVICTIFSLVVSSASVFLQAEETFAHGGYPDVALWVLLDIEDAHRLADAQINRVEASGCIHIAQTVGIGSHPGSALLVLTEGEHGALVQEMPLYAVGCYIK